MNTTASNPNVIREIESLKYLVPFGIKHRNVFHEVRGISIDDRGHLVYINENNDVKSVSSLIKQIKRIQTARWINHLYFKDGFGIEHSFKTFVSQKYNLNFT